jgi:hypothetical protein
MTPDPRQTPAHGEIYDGTTQIRDASTDTLIGHAHAFPHPTYADSTVEYWTLLPGRIIQNVTLEFRYINRNAGYDSYFAGFVAFSWAALKAAYPAIPHIQTFNHVRVIRGTYMD